MPIILGILGLLVGLALDDPVTGVLGAALGFLLGSHLGTQKRLARLEKTLAQWQQERTPSTKAGPAGAVESAAKPEPPPPPSETAEPGEKSPEPEPASAAMVATPLIPPSVSITPASEGPPRATDSSKASRITLTDRLGQAIWRYFSGGNIVVRVGVIVLFFGVAFLLRYAAEHAWIPIELRLTGVALGGLAMLGVGWRLRSQRFGYGLVLQGGGIGVLYLTVFAAFRLYNLLPAPLAFTVLIACALFSTVIAVLQDARSLAVMGIAGGFLAPVLASTGQGSHIALFSYYLILNASILAIAWFKAWRPLNILGFVFTFVIASLWGYRYYQPAYYSSTEPFLILFFLFYIAIPILFALRQPPKLRGYVDGSLIFGVPLAAFALQAALVSRYEYGLAWSGLALGIFYLSLAWALLQRLDRAMRTLAEAFMAIGIVFATLTIPLALEARWTSAMWALEGAALIWIGTRQQRLLARLSGVLLQLGAGLSYGFALRPPDDRLAFLNADYLGVFILALAGLFSAYYLWRQRDLLKDQERFLVELLFIWGGLWWFGGGLQQIDRYLPGYRWGSIVLFLGISGLIAHLFARHLSWPLLGYLALGLLPALGLVVLTEGWRVSHPFAQLGLLAWPFALGVHYLILYQWENKPLSRLRWLHAGGLWLLTLILTWELAWDVDQAVQGAGTWGLIMWGAVPGLLLSLVFNPEPRPVWPLRRHADTYRTLGGWPLVIYLWLWILFANFSGPGDPWPLPYFPLLNPLDVAIAFALLILLIWSRAVTATGIAIPKELTSSRRLIILSATAFLWVNGLLIRSMHYWAGIPFTLSAMFDSILVQAGLTLLWSLLGVAWMLFATRRRQRPLWLAGAGLMTAVVGKLFLIDLSATGTMERIVAFIAVGILLLIVGYFAPVPPRIQETPEKSPP